MGRRAWPLLERRLGSARHLGQHLQRFHHRLLTNLVAADSAEAALFVRTTAIARGDSKMHQPHRFAWGRATRARDPCNGNCEICIGMLQRTEGHGGRGFLAHRAECLECRGLDA